MLLVHNKTHMTMICRGGERQHFTCKYAVVLIKTGHFFFDKKVVLIRVVLIRTGDCIINNN